MLVQELLMEISRAERGGFSQISVMERLRQLSSDSKLYVTFTEDLYKRGDKVRAKFQPKLGINPSSGYNTPLGIYAYRLSDYANRLNSGEYGSPMQVFPFAGENPNVWVFEARAGANIIDLETVSNINIYFGVLNFLIKNFDEISIRKGLDRYLTVIDSEDFDDEGVLETVHNSLYTRFVTDKEFNMSVVQQEMNEHWDSGQVLWEMIRLVANILVEKDGRKVSVVWSSICRKLGIDGFVDGGAGIIHPNEPAQAVFFDKSVIDVKELLRQGRTRFILTVDTVRSVKGLLRGIMAGESTIDDISHVKSDNVHKSLNVLVSQIRGISLKQLKLMDDISITINNSGRSRRYIISGSNFVQTMIPEMLHILVEMNRRNVNIIREFPWISEIIQQNNLLDRYKRKYGTAQAFSSEISSDDKSSFTHPKSAYEYAAKFKKRYPNGEKLIAQHPYYAYLYAKDVIGGRFPEGEAAIAKDAVYSYWYAHDVIKGRFPAGEAAIAIATNSVYKQQYEDYFGVKL